MRGSLVLAPRFVGLTFLVVLGLLAGLWPATARAQPAPAGVVTTLVGQAVVVRAAAPAPAPLKFKDAVFGRDRIETRADSLVRVLLGGKVLATIRELSVFTITEQPGRATVDLGRGKVALGVTKDRLGPGEAIEIRTPNAVAAVRGSSLIAEVTEVGGVPQSEFTALEATLPITVSPLGAPEVVVGLRVNEAVSVIGAGAAAVLGPVRGITPGQAQAAGRVRQAPKPKEQTDKPPERVARKVSEDKAKEAAQLTEVLTRGDATLGEDGGLSPALAREVSGFQRAFRRTLEIVGITEERVDRARRETLFDVVVGFRIEPPFIPGRELSQESLALSAGETLASFTGTATADSSPVLYVAGSEIIQSGAGTLIRVDPGANVSLAGRLLASAFSDLSTGGSLLSLGDGASLASGAGGFALLDFDHGSVATGAPLVALGVRARLSLERTLLAAAGATLVSGDAGKDSTPLIALGPGAALELIPPAVALLELKGGSVTTGGSLLSLGEGATLTGVGGALGLLTIDQTTISAGGELVALQAGARMSLDQSVLSLSSADLVIGPGTGGPRSLIALGPGAQLDTSTALPAVDVTRGSLSVGGSLLFLDAGASFLSRGVTVTALVALTETRVTTGGDGFALLAGSRLDLKDRSLLSAATDSTVSFGGTLLSLGGDAVLSTGGASLVPLVSLDRSTLSVATALVRLGAGAQLGLGRPLLSAAEGSAVTVGGSVLSLGDSALLEASAPLMSLTGTSGLTTGGPALDLSLRAKLTAFGPVVRLGKVDGNLDGSTLTVGSGALFGLAGGSTLKVTGDLVELANGSTLNLLAGPVVSVSGGSVVTASGALIAFTGGGNKVSISNTLCPCTLVSGVPVALRDGALASNVTIGPNVIKNPSLGTVTLGSASTAAIVVTGATSKVSIAAP